ncbi:GNAT family N-acetyltransferase [Rossellomorea aquimaris]|uniref:GNAT family N-acetyltransferase n=1 Tax=Rossellomorea aquimaris TaxID=189382 RepID=UPI0007D066E6|nr:GNAT family N-acetyltransferase [Rossellomorea aquimaris]
MVYSKNKIHIRPVELKDKQILAKWLSNPVVLEYYEGRDRPFNQHTVQEKLIHRTGGVTGCIVEYEGKEIGYLQYYPLDKESKKKYGFSIKEENIYGTDQFIGEAEYWNKGIGTELVQTMMEFLIKEKGAKRLVMDPMIWNERAIRCYEKCGYKKNRILPGNELHEGVYHDSWLMEYVEEVLLK